MLPVVHSLSASVDEEVHAAAALRLFTNLVLHGSMRHAAISLQADDIIVAIAKRFPDSLLIQDSFARAVANLAAAGEGIQARLGANGAFKVLLQACAAHGGSTALVHAAVTAIGNLMVCWRNRQRFSDLDGEDILIAFAKEYESDRHITNRIGRCLAMLASKPSTAERLNAKATAVGELLQELGELHPTDAKLKEWVGVAQAKLSDPSEPRAPRSAAGGSESKEAKEDIVV